jgi:hypothetical protein
MTRNRLITLKTARGPLLQEVGMELDSAPCWLGIGALSAWGFGAPGEAFRIPAWRGMTRGATAFPRVRAPLAVAANPTLALSL